MKKKVIIIGIVFILILMILGFYFIGKTTEKSDSIEGTITTIHKDFKAIINTNWQEFEGSHLSYIFYTYLPENEDAKDINAEFIFVSVGYIGEENNYSLDELLDAGIENSKTTMLDLELTNNIDKQGKYLAGKEIKFTGTSEGIKRDFIQFFGLKYGNIYTITYSCPINNCNYYSEYDTFVESFEPKS